jgi:hypothetical protein
MQTQLGRKDLRAGGTNHQMDTQARAQQHVEQACRVGSATGARNPDNDVMHV